MVQTVLVVVIFVVFFFFFQAEDGIRDLTVTGVQTCCSSDLANAREEWGRRGAGSSGGADAGRDVEPAPAPARVGSCPGAGGARRAVSRGGRGAGRAQGAAAGAAHASPLGYDGDGADVRWSTGADAASASPAHEWRRSDVALGGAVSGARPADRADDAATPRRGVDPPGGREARDAAGRAAHPRQ